MARQVALLAGIITAAIDMTRDKGKLSTYSAEITETLEELSEVAVYFGLL